MIADVAPPVASPEGTGVLLIAAVVVAAVVVAFGVLWAWARRSK